jgi:hypothetical protein
MPGTSCSPASRAAAPAASLPAVVSWSVMLMMERPATRAWETSSDGVSVPSEAVV